MDPTRVYCLADPNNDTGVRAQRTEGWLVETHRKDGPRIIGGDTAKDGDALAINDQVVMSRPRAMQEEYERQKLATADRRSVSIGQKGGLDPFVGPTGRMPQFIEDPREERVRS